MIYPEFIKKNGVIGICAPSAGVGKKLDSFLDSNRYLKSLGYKIKESESVRVNNERSASKTKRAQELDALVIDKRVNIIMCAAGGDYMYEMLPYVDFDHIKENPKWICGASDPTNLLFTMTTNLDIATLYGRNGAGFSLDNDKSQDDFFKIIKGDLVKQKSFKKYRSFIDAINDVNEFNSDVKYVGSGDFDIKGRLIGGCLDVICKLIGTKFDKTNEFIDRYKDDGIIWYFDIFSMSAYDFYLTLLQLENAGWFRYCKGILLGRVAFERIDDPKLDYIKALKKVAKNIPYACEMDIGHTDPCWTLINGAIAGVKVKDNKGEIKFELIV